VSLIIKNVKCFKQLSCPPHWGRQMTKFGYFAFKMNMRGCTAHGMLRVYLTPKQHMPYQTTFEITSHLAAAQ